MKELKHKDLDLNYRILNKNLKRKNLLFNYLKK